LGEAGSGFGHDFLIALKELDSALRTKPKSWGDPIRDYKTLDLRLYHRYGPILQFEYAVHLKKPLVIVRVARLNPGSKLYDSFHDKS